MLVVSGKADSTTSHTGLASNPAILPIATKRRAERGVDQRHRDWEALREFQPKKSYSQGRDHRTQHEPESEKHSKEKASVQNFLIVILRIAKFAEPAISPRSQATIRGCGLGYKHRG